MSITVDPERDTLEILAQYARNHGVDPAGWAFLTGTPSEIQDVERRYGIYAKKTERGDVDHTFLTSIVDQRGILRVQYLGIRFDPEEFLRDLRSLLREAKTPVIDRLPRLVARLPLSVHGKLLFAFLAIVGLLIAVGAVGLQVLSGVNRRAEDMVKLQRKIAAYRQLQHDTTSQLYGVSSALLVPDDRTLEATLRQLNQFGYDLDRLAFVAQDEVELLRARARGLRGVHQGRHPGDRADPGREGGPRAASSS